MPSAFETGQRLGMEAVQAGSNQAQIALRTREARREFDIQNERTQKQDEITNRLNEDRQHMIRGDYLMRQSQREMEMKLQQDEIQRLLQSEAELKAWETGFASLDESSPTFLDDYSKLNAKHMPGISKHPSTLRRFEATDKALQQSQKITIRKMMELGMLNTMKEGAAYAPAETQVLLKSAMDGQMPLDQAAAQINNAITAGKELERRQKLADSVAIAGARAGVAKEKADRSVTIKTIDKNTGEEITETLTPEELDARKAKEKTAAEDAAVAPLVRMYREHAANIQAGDKRTGFANMSSREARMKAIETQLRAKGYDTEGNRLGSAKPAESPATNDDPLGLYK